MPKPEAQELVKAACRESLHTHTHIMEILSQKTDYPIDWQELKDVERYTGLAGRRGDGDADKSDV
jgi:hypothetical protein